MKNKEKLIALELRNNGYSIKEIAKQLNVSKGSVSIWVRDVVLSNAAKEKLFEKIKIGQYVSAEKKKASIKLTEDRYLMNARAALVKSNILKIYPKEICAALYWCEGAKSPKYGVAFMNSDPGVMKLFINLFEKSFVVDKSRFRALLHVHPYHNPLREIDFWSKAIKIERKQFLRPYIKKNGGRSINKDYHGCLSFRYHDTDIARQLIAMGIALREP